VSVTFKEEDATPEQLEKMTPEPDNAAAMIDSAREVHTALDVAVAEHLMTDLDGGIWTASLASRAVERLDEMCPDGTPHDDAVVYYRDLLTGAVFMLANVMMGGLDDHDPDGGEGESA
jgi:hypothetical protein